MIECFPVTERIKTHREQQLEIANWIEAGLKEGKTKFIPCAPTGSGKSAIARAFSCLPFMKLCHWWELLDI